MALFILALVVVALIGLIVLAKWSQRLEPKVGVVNGNLLDCPPSPNCVCSTASRASQQIAAFDWPAAVDDPIDWLAQSVEAMPRCRIADRRSDYLRIELQSRVFGFVDDMEFLVNRDKRRIEVRSCARVGRSDFGANRRYVERVRLLSSATTGMKSRE